MTVLETSIQQSNLAIAHDKFQKGLRAHAMFKLHNQSTSDDLVQDTFMKTWLYLVHGGKIDVMKAFLYHVLNNLIIDEYRRHKATSLDALLEQGFTLPSTDIEQSSHDKPRDTTILDSIDRLPQPYQKVVHMRFLQDLTLHEISLITGQTKNTVAVQIHRGLKKLKLLYLA